MNPARSLPFICLFILLHPSPLVATSAAQVAEDETDPEVSWELWEEVLAALALLREGSREQKLALFEDQEDFDGPLMNLDEPPGDDPELLNDAIAELHAWFRREEDSFIVDRAGAWLAWWGFEETRPIFQDLAHHAVPSVRYRAVQYAMEMWEDDDAVLLRGMWAAEPVAWVRAAILEGLLDIEDELPTAFCASPAWAADPELVLAAFYCLESADDPEAGEILARRAAAGSDLIRHAAIRSLETRLYWEDAAPELRALVEELWAGEQDSRFLPALLRVLDATDSPVAVEVARDLMWSTDQDLAIAAVGVLGFRRPEGTQELLMDRAFGGDDQVRAAAIQALDEPVLGDGIEKLLIAATEQRQPTAVRCAAVGVLSAHGPIPQEADDGTMLLSDAAAEQVALFRRIAENDPDAEVRSTASQAVARLEEGRHTLTSSCGVGTLYDADEFRVVGHPDGASRRCWKRPSEAKEAGDSARLPRDLRVVRNDRFDDGVQEWALVHSFQHECWVPADGLRRVDPLALEPLPVAPPDPEFDIEARCLENDRFRDLERSGKLQVFDRTDTMVGVRLSGELREMALTKLSWFGQSVVIRGILHELTVPCREAE